MSTWIGRLRVLRWCLAAGLAISTGAAADVVFNVDSTLDQVDDDTSDGVCRTAADTCTLRAAVMQANRISGVGSTIDLPAGIYTLTRPATGADGDDNGDLNLTTPVSGSASIAIRGAGAASTIIDANQLDRVLAVHVDRTASLQGLTLRNGYVPTATGGGIMNSGSLTLNECTIEGNSAHDGGGIVNLGTASIHRTTVKANFAIDLGGGIAIANFASFYGTDSTISMNTAQRGGGIGGFGILTIINTTIYGNSADGSGGGIYDGSTWGPFKVFSSTIAGNGADADADPDGGIGGGVYVAAGSSFHMRNTLLVGNTLANAPIYDDCWGTVNSYGRNLFWEPGDGCTIVIQSGSAWLLNSLDDLGLLQSNGGPTETVALRPGSNAIDGGDPVLGCIGPDLQPFTTDQRGAARAVGVRCDIGAFEHGALPAGYLFGDGFELGNLWAWGGG